MEHSCDWYTQLLGNDPQSGERINKWGCAVGFLPMLLIEGAQSSRQTTESIQVFRDEVIKGNAETIERIQSGQRRIA